MRKNHNVKYKYAPGETRILWQDIEIDYFLLHILQLIQEQFGRYTQYLDKIYFSKNEYDLI